MEYGKELDRLLAKVKGREPESTEKALDTYYEICCGCVLAAEENLRENDRIWENAGLAETLLVYAGYLEGYGHMLDSAYAVTMRMCKVICEHPRLKLRLLRLLLTIIRGLEARSGHDLSFAEDVCNEISLFERNIALADSGELGRIRNAGSLKHDPVEWTLAWEENIDKADRAAYRNLEGCPRGMGFCFGFWSERRNALERLGIEWKSPAAMNPGVIFD